MGLYIHIITAQVEEKFMKKQLFGDSFEAQEASKEL